MTLASLLKKYLSGAASYTEDGCKGRFWEHRFTSQAILDDDALLRTLAYVDLNPVRAGIASTPETSEHTSIHRRLSKIGNNADTTIALLPFQQQNVDQQTPLSSSDTALPISFNDYLTLLDWTGLKRRWIWQAADHEIC